jgi:hypothetical protein
VSRPGHCIGLRPVSERAVSSARADGTERQSEGWLEHGGGSRDSWEGGRDAWGSNHAWHIEEDEEDSDYEDDDEDNEDDEDEDGEDR